MASPRASPRLMAATHSSSCCSVHELALSYQIARHYTYGQPRVGNESFHDFYNDNSPRVTWRLTHWRDPVPHLPLESMGFSHIGTEVWNDKDWTHGKVWMRRRHPP